MAVPRPFATMSTADQWCRAAHFGTAVEAGGVVRLAHLPEAAPGPGGPEPQPRPPAGLAFDPWCRLFHSVPEEGLVERQLWQVFADPLRSQAGAPEPFEIFAAPAPLGAPLGGGDFAPEGGAPPALRSPLGLACDEEGRLFVAEKGAARVLVYDLRERRLLRRLQFPRPAEPGFFYKPLDLAGDGRRVWALAAGAPVLFSFEARGEVREIPLPALPAGTAEWSRLAVDPPTGAIFLLAGAGTEAAWVCPLAAPEKGRTVAFASDLEIERPAAGATEGDGRGALVVARLAGQDLLRFDSQGLQPAGRPFLKARGYDGRAIVAAPEGRIAFWTASGPRLAVLFRERYEMSGRVVTYLLDSGSFETRWGRLFLDACVPRDSEVRFFCTTADEVPEGPELPRQAPAAGLPLSPAQLLGVSPPLPPLSLLPAGADLEGAELEERLQPLHRRANGRELPWTPPLAGAFENFATYEAPVGAPPGRYLWVLLELRGKGGATPRIKSLRAEYPGHELLRRLPKVYSRDLPAADFLRRYLAPLEGFLGELDGRSSLRRALLDPFSAPQECLPWLASLLGLLLDERWPLAARRRLIAEAAWLFRFRGTLPGLVRLLQIYLGRPPVVVEHFRLRGLGGAIVGATGGLESTAVVGGGLRVGGPSTDAGAAGAPDRHAHRFTVLVPAQLADEGREVLQHILDEHRPAHTVFELCAVDTGMRAGLGLYAGVSTLVGKTGGFGQLQVGGSLLGTDAVLGRPRPGTSPGASRVGLGTEVG